MSVLLANVLCEVELHARVLFQCVCVATHIALRPLYSTHAHSYLKYNRSYAVNHGK